MKIDLNLSKESFDTLTNRVRISSNENNALYIDNNGYIAVDIPAAPTTSSNSAGNGITGTGTNGDVFHTNNTVTLKVNSPSGYNIMDIVSHLFTSGGGGS